MGPVQTVNFLTALNIPPMSVNTLKAREREIGKTIEDYAKSTCLKALQEEIIMNRQENKKDEETEDTVNVSFDGAWQKRGSGRCYSSLTGHATLIGEHTGKCLDYGLKSKDCRKCDHNDEKVDAHDCRKNYHGSAKSMESVLAVEMVKNVQDFGCKVTSITMDDDSTTIARIRHEVNEEIVKYSDKNHFRKNVSRNLFALHEKHKTLTTSVITYLMKNLSYAISQNKNSTENLEKSLKAIVPHSFGDHSLCNITWCQYSKDPASYKHGGLPYGKDMTGEQLRNDLTELFNIYANNKEKICKLGSSQGNESLNFMISTKAPKAKHFGGSESLSFRVASGVAQKNEGRSYIMKVNEKHSLSPGKFTSQQRVRMDKKRKYEKEKSGMRDAKKQRLRKKDKKMTNEKTKELREGKTYLTGICSTSKIEPIDIELKPAPENDPVADKIKLEKSVSVYFDLETTGFGTDCDIIQVAAISQGKQDFNKYILPSKPITTSASKVTGFSKLGHVLYRNGQIMQTDSRDEVFRALVDWLPAKSVMIGHNVQLFDSRLLVKAASETGFLDPLQEKCTGFVDTLLLCKSLLPERKLAKKSFSQEALVHDLVGVKYDAHNAIGDVRSLQQLIDKLDVEQDVKEQCSFSVDFTLKSLTLAQTTASYLDSLKEITNEVASKGMVRKIARSGLNMQHLIMAFTRDGNEGVTRLLSEHFNGKPRVTKNKKILLAITNYIKSKC